jgi:ATP-dependent Lon protease
MAIALISALTRRPVRGDLAMTGEITLRGRVLGIGGLKEKTMAAHRVGIRHLLVPAENAKDLAEIPAKIRADMHFTLVESMEDVVLAALLPPLPEDERPETAADSAAAEERDHPAEYPIPEPLLGEVDPHPDVAPNLSGLSGHDGEGHPPSVS